MNQKCFSTKCRNTFHHQMYHSNNIFCIFKSNKQLYKQNKTKKHQSIDIKFVMVFSTRDGDIATTYLQNGVLLQRLK